MSNTSGRHIGEKESFRGACLLETQMDGWIDEQAEPGTKEEERPYRKHTYVRPSLPMMTTCSLPVPSHHVQILNLYDTIIREQLQACQGSAQQRLRVEMRGEKMESAKRIIRPQWGLDQHDAVPSLASPH